MLERGPRDEQNIQDLFILFQRNKDYAETMCHTIT